MKQDTLRSLCAFCLPCTCGSLFCYHEVMDRLLDKTIVLTSCLLTVACFLAETGVAVASMAASMQLLSCAVAMVVAIACSAIVEAFPLRIGIIVTAAYCVAACFFASALPFVPLAIYDFARCIYRSDALRFSGAFGVMSLIVCLATGALPLLSSASLLCASLAAAALSIRTSMVLARQRIAWNTRDALASQTITLRDRNHTLAESLEQLQAQADTPEPHDNAAVAQRRPTPFACLTEREYEVARLVAKGLDNREIAATAFLSEGTVRNNISSILSKMDLENRTQIAVAWWSSTADHR